MHNLCRRVLAHGRHFDAIFPLLFINSSSAYYYVPETDQVTAALLESEAHLQWPYNTKHSSVGESELDGFHFIELLLATLMSLCSEHINANKGREYILHAIARSALA